MVYDKRYILAATDYGARHKAFAKFRGKTAMEVYRFGKGVFLTQSITGPLRYALMEIPKELSSGFINSAIGSTVETMIGYVSGIGFVRWVYKTTDIGTIKTLARITYNVCSLPVTAYSKGFGFAFDLIQISRLEQWWFGKPVYIFDDNRLWIEKNFTIGETFKLIEQAGD